MKDIASMLIVSKARWNNPCMVLLQELVNYIAGTQKKGDTQIPCKMTFKGPLTEFQEIKNFYA